MFLCPYSLYVKSKTLHKYCQTKRCRADARYRGNVNKNADAWSSSILLSPTACPEADRVPLQQQFANPTAWTVLPGETVCRFQGCPRSSVS
jgi:hypothetical protein